MTRSPSRLITRADDPHLHQQLREIACELGCKIIAVGNTSDHVHVILCVVPTLALAEVVRRLKGRTSFVGRWSWQRGYYAESVGIADLQPICRYVERQRQHHDDSHPAESWCAQWESADRRT